MTTRDHDGLNREQVRRMSRRYILIGLFAGLLAVATWIITLAVTDLKPRAAYRTLTKPSPQLTSQWHREEEAKINQAVTELRAAGKWNERWDKFSMLGDYGWRNGIDCGDGTKPMPCMSGGYTFSQEAFNKLKRGDLTHDAHNTAEEGFKSFQAAIPRKR